MSKSMAYDHPAYVSRLAHNFGMNAAGASTVLGKFTAFTALTIFAVVASAITNGTSTTTGWNGTGTGVTIQGDSYSVIWVHNTAAIGAAAGLNTATFGPFINQGGVGTGTLTAAAGYVNYIPLWAGTAGTGTAQAGTNSGVGGFNIAQGDTIHVVRGTDATAVTGFTLEYGITPLAPLTT